MIKRYAVAVFAAVGLLYLPGCSDNVPEQTSVQDAGQVEAQMANQKAEYKQSSSSSPPKYASSPNYPTGQAGQGGY